MEKFHGNLLRSGAPSELIWLQLILSLSVCPRSDLRARVCESSSLGTECELRSRSCGSTTPGEQKRPHKINTALATTTKNPNTDDGSTATTTQCQEAKPNSTGNYYRINVPCNQINREAQPGGGSEGVVQ